MQSSPQNKQKKIKMKYVTALLLHFLPLLVWSQKGDDFYFQSAKIKLLCETGRFYLVAEKGHTQKEIDAFPCDNCKECDASWSSLVSNLPIEEERVDAFKEIYETNYETYGGNNSLDMKITKVITNIRSKLLANLISPTNIANSKTLVQRLYILKNQILQEQKQELEEIEQEKTNETQKIAQQKKDEERKQIEAENNKIQQEKEEQQRILTEKDERFNGLWIWIFRSIVFISILGMIGSLGYLISRGKKGEWMIRLFSMVIALSLIIIIDVFTNLNLSKFIVSSFLNFDTSVLQGKIMSVIITIVYGIVGYLIAKHIKSVLEQKNNKSTRYFIVIATVLIFFFIRLFIASSQVETSAVLIPNAAFILGFGFYTIAKIEIDI